MTPDRKADLEATLAKMKRVSDAFYGMVIQTECHPFVEFTGFMNEYINMCKHALDRGVDFAEANTHQGAALDMEPHHAKYLAEKFDRIFGPTLRSKPELHDVFWKILHGEADPRA
jgi:hypothetical protein